MTAYEVGYNEGRKGNHSPRNQYESTADRTEFDRGVKDGWAHYCNMMQSGA